MAISDKIKFGADGLVPVIAVDCVTNAVLMQAYADKQAIDLCESTGYAHYYSRSRKTLWKKGETSGHVQRIVEILCDCDFDSVLLRVEQTGAACHTGNRTCFFNSLKVFDDKASADALFRLCDVVEERRNNPKEGSYTNYLLNKGNEKICKKIGEEASECIIAAMKRDKNELSCELSDLAYHCAVLMNENGVSPSDVFGVLKSRQEKK